MSNYYEYRRIKVDIAERLMQMDGWKVYGYTEDTSDAMTDYYDPAIWSGVAEKNGYILCVDVYGAEKETILYDTKSNKAEQINRDKIAKLERMTMANGASAQEEMTARAAIKKLLSKVGEEQSKERVEIGRVPAHMAHPNRCNWHIEKDGQYIAKGNGILKLETNLPRWQKEAIECYKEIGAEAYEKEVYKNIRDKYKTDERAWEAANYSVKNLQEKIKGLEKFDAWIQKIDKLCGGMVGKGKTERYETKIVTEYKDELKPFPCDGEVKEGQLFILNVKFSRGASKGNVYKIESIAYNRVLAYKLNGKYTKLCTGTASQGNRFSAHISDFNGYIQKGYISYCELRTIKVERRKEKVVKVKDDSAKESNIHNDGEFTVSESMHTKTGKKIWLVKYDKQLDADGFKELLKKIKKAGGYYSKFTHTFVFNEKPDEALKEISIA